MKIERKPLPLICPNPVILVTTEDKNGRENIITITLAGGISWEPPIIAIGIGKSQYSQDLVKQLGEFVVNIPTAEMIQDVEYCGFESGVKRDKFENTSFTPLSSTKVKPSMIKECPLNLECKVIKVVPLGLTVLFLGEVVFFPC